MSQLPATSSSLRTRPQPLLTWLRLVLALAKPGIVQMVTITAAVGFTLALLSPAIAITIESLLVLAPACVFGTVLSAAGANTLNQAMEHRRDARMERTCARPIPSGDTTARIAWVVGTVECLLGAALLFALTGPAPALVALVTTLTYLTWYTPLKPHTSFSTLVGAFPGALPPLIGWTAASGGALGTLTDLAGWALVAIVFVWQMPHFLAIAWLYRKDYERGGYRVLPVEDPSGLRAGLESVLWSALLIPVSMTPVLWMRETVGPVAMVIAMIAGLLFFHRAVRFLHERTDAHARSLFFASIIYLPVVLVSLVADALVRALL